MMIELRHKFLFGLLFIASVSFAQTSPSLQIDAGALVIVEGDGGTGTDGALIVEGDLIMDGTLDLQEDAIVQLTGDFFRNNEGLSEGLSTFIFNGTAAQEITRSAGPSAFDETFYNLSFDNAAGVTINSAEVNEISVKNVLNPVNGTLSTNDKLLLSATSWDVYARVAFGNGDIDGEVKVEKVLTNTNANWRQMSMPVDKTWGNGNWTGITFNFSDHLPSNEINSFRWKSSGAGGVADGWLPAAGTTLGSTPLTLYNEGGNSMLDISQNLACQGELRDNVASFGYTLQLTRDPQDISGSDPAAVGWNNIPNPWASLIDVQALLSTNTPLGWEPAYQAVHVFNSVSGQYQAILLDNTVTKVDWNTDGADIENADANIPPFQAFWVKADVQGQRITLFPDEMQTTEFKNQANEQFMKKKPDLFRLNVFDADSLWDQIVVFFKEGATREFDLVGDAYHLASPVEEAPLFYALEDKSAASILGRPLESTDSVEVSYGSKKAGTTFHIMPDISELPDDWNVYLKDRYTGQTVQVENRKSYAFINQNEESSKRFVIYFSKQPQAFNHLVTGEAPEIYAFAKDGQIAIQSLGISGPATINLFDMTGKQLQNQQVVLQTGDQHVINTTISGAMVLLCVEVNGRIENFKLFL